MFHNIIKLALFALITVAVISANASSDIPYSVETQVMTKSLKNRVFSTWYKKDEIQNQIDALVQSAKEGPNYAYSLTMPLLASAELGDDVRYKNILPLVMAAIEKMPTEQASFKAWLYGRVALSADYMSDQKTLTSATALLASLVNDKNTNHDELYSWSLGYLASLNNKWYEECKSALLNSAKDVTAIFSSLATSNNGEAKQDANALQAARSNAIWCWVMIASASANAKDAETYQTALEQIRTITNEKTIDVAIAKGLLRTSASNDYPAWAIGIVMLSASEMHDDVTYEQLSKMLKQSIQSANDWKPTPIAEIVLGELNAELALLQQSPQPARAAPISDISNKLGK